MPQTILEIITSQEQKLVTDAARLESLRAIAARFPDAELRPSWRDGQIWVAKSAHEAATGFDPWILGIYAVIGGFRVYSARPINPEAGFSAFHSPGYAGSLLDALRSTTEAEERRIEEISRRF